MQSMLLLNSLRSFVMLLLNSLCGFVMDLQVCGEGKLEILIKLYMWRVDDSIM